jgi:hypothetical protein
MVAGDWIAFDNAGVSNKALISAIPLSIFNNDSGWTTNTGTVDTSGTPVTNDYARFIDADTIEGRSYAEMKTDTGFMTDLVDDTTPQLGADLQCNGFDLLDVHGLGFDAIPDTNLTGNGPQTDSMNAGATLAMGDVVYLNASSQWVLADASAEATSTGALGICLEAGTSGNPINVAVHGCFVRQDSWAWATVGQKLYVSETAGDLTATAPSTSAAIVRVAAYVFSADVVEFLPSSSWVEIL